MSPKIFGERSNLKKVVLHPNRSFPKFLDFWVLSPCPQVEHFNSTFGALRGVVLLSASRSCFLESPRCTRQRRSGIFSARGDESESRLRALCSEVRGARWRWRRFPCVWTEVRSQTGRTLQPVFMQAEPVRRPWQLCSWNVRVVVVLRGVGSGSPDERQESRNVVAGPRCVAFPVLLSA